MTISTFIIIEEMSSVQQHLEKSTFFHYFCLLKLYLNASYTKMEGHKEDLRSQMFLHFYFATGRKQDWKGFQFSWLRKRLFEVLLICIKSKISSFVTHTMFVLCLQMFMMLSGNDYLGMYIGATLQHISIGFYICVVSVLLSK